MNRSRLQGLLVAVLLAAPGSSASAQPTPAQAPALPLDSVLARVRAANPALAAARLESAVLSTRRPRVTAWNDPMVSATVNTGPGRMQRAQIMVEQPLPWPDVLRSRGESADAAVEAASFRAEATEADLVLEATLAYVEAAGIEQQIAQIAHFREELAAFEEAAAVQYETGAGPQQAILRMQLEKNGLARRVLALDARLRSLREALGHLTGQSGDPAWIDRGLVLPDPGPDPAITRDGSATRRLPEWRAREAAIRQATTEGALARKAFRPEVSIRLAWMEGAVMRDYRDAAGIGFGMRVPLWRAPRHAAVEEKELELQRLEALQDDLASRTVTRTRALLASVGSHRETLGLLDGTLLPQAEATQQATVSAYTNGRADYLDLLEAERVLMDLRLDRIAHQVQLLQDLATLERIAPSPATDLDS